MFFKRFSRETTRPYCPLRASVLCAPSVLGYFTELKVLTLNYEEI